MSADSKGSVWKKHIVVPCDGSDNEIVITRAHVKHGVLDVDIAVDETTGNVIISGKSPFHTKEHGTLDASKVEQFVKDLAHVATHYLRSAEHVTLRMGVDNFVDPLIRGAKKTEYKDAIRPITSTAGTHPTIGAVVDLKKISALTS